MMNFWAEGNMSRTESRQFDQSDTGILPLMRDMLVSMCWILVEQTWNIKIAGMTTKITPNKHCSDVKLDSYIYKAS